MEQQKRVFTFVASIDQLGRTYKNKEGDIVLADPNHNECFKKVAVKVEIGDDSPVPITKVAGRIADACSMWAAKQGRTSTGIVKAAGFNLTLSIITVEQEGEVTTTVGTVEKMRLSSPIDVTSNITAALLSHFGGDNSEGYATGVFHATAEGKLVMKKLGYGEAMAAIDNQTQRFLLDTKRKEVKKIITAKRQEALASAGIQTAAMRAKALKALAAAAEAGQPAEA